ncbi:DNA-processing protein DprA [Romboutsia sp.]|uniref:DNA-processing protein DprA n=1 Tax=Romboutsia sp. TaxID=1965302 RepID=UPI003F2E5D9B
MEKKDLYLWTKLIGGMNYKTIDMMRENGTNLENIFELSNKEIYKLENINSNIKENIVKYKSIAYLDEMKEKLHNKSIQYVSIEDDNYPENLKHIYNPPNVLFYKGDINVFNNISLAMVGSRKATNYGIDCAKKLSKKLSDVGINIVSGLAIGIDSYSHIGCMNGNSKTISVLASSVDNPLPKQNIKLANKILEEGGLLLSEYYIEDRVYPSNFSQRNRIISGISDGVIVVEAGEKSGALITVEYALNQGKNVFSLPGRIDSYNSKGSNKIIKEGAKLVDSIEDILEEYQINSIKDKENYKNYDNIGLSKESIIIIEQVKYNGVLHIDEICANTRMEIKSVNLILNELVLNDLLVEKKNQTYCLNI